MKDDLIVLMNFSTRVQAMIVQSKLSAFGIMSYIQADDAGGLYPFPGRSGFGQVKLIIRKTDYIKARKII